MKLQLSYALAELVAFTAAIPQVPVRPYVDRLVLVGDGSPRQAYLYEQVTEDNHCGGPDESCGISRVEVESSSIGFHGDVSASGWISGGFSVAKSKSTGQTATCNAGTGDSVANKACVWARIAHTGYEVQMRRISAPYEDRPEEAPAQGDPFFLWSPNEREGHGFQCAHDDECQSMGDTWWGYMSEGDRLWEAVSNKGGPQPFVWGSDPENRWN